LGGAKNHIIVMLDAVVAPSIENITESAFGNAGQRCLAGSVMTVVGRAADEFLPRFVERADRITMGFGLDEGIELGPVIRDDSRQRILGYIERGVSSGEAHFLRDGRGGSTPQCFLLGSST